MDMTYLNASADSTRSVSTTANAAKQNSADTQDRFLKLLVAQMQNQDPMNPMDNAQVTSQMAQIQTVSGVADLTSAVKGLNAQFLQFQELQGVSLVGRDVQLPGNRLSINNNQGTGSYALKTAADKVKLEILAANGAVVSTVELGAQTAGDHDFKWTAASVDPNAGLTFRVTATQGAATVKSQTLMLDKVTAVSAGSNGLMLDLLYSGLTSYNAINELN